ncbi:MAG TPA: DUF2795 domain-containing protein [Ktedonobacteraceae bacterium]|nr:DUF2795 domain-containing protein [Ktedonobacteraceae bacterium]
MAVNPIQLEKYLKGVNYPASKNDLIKQAQQNGADQNVLDTLKKLPDRNFDGPTGISKASG